MFRSFRKIVLFGLTAVSTFVSAQETQPFFQQYLLGGNFFFNPAHYGETDDVKVRAIYQKQFSKFDQSPNVQAIGMHANIFDRVGAGLSFFRDENGVISSNGISAGLSYFIPLDDNNERDEQFSFGSSVNLYNMNFDYGGLNPTNPGDPVLGGGANSVFLAHANLGMQAKYRNISAGIAVNDIALNKNVSVTNGIEPAPTRFFVNLGYDWKVSEDISVEPSALVNMNSNSSRMFDLNVLAHVYGDNTKYTAGFSYRTAANGLGSEQLSLSPILMGKVGRFSFGAVYNFSLSDISDVAGNGFTITLGYDLPNFINSYGFRY